MSTATVTTLTDNPGAELERAPRALLGCLLLGPGPYVVLRVAFWINVGLLLFGVIAMPFDHRIILGLNPWIKPVKFDLSVLLYCATVLVLLYLLGPGWRGLRNVIAAGAGAAMIVENVIISLQSLRGVPSHMNYTSLFNGFAFGIMGVFILVNTVLLALLLVLYLVTRTGLRPALAWGIRLGLALFVAGSLEGALMVQHNGHTVGARDGLPGLPFVNWSSGHGDLRIAHFFALHALQLAPLLGYWLSRTRLAVPVQLTLLVLGVLAYTGFVWMLFQQAMAGHPLFG